MDEKFEKFDEKFKKFDEKFDVFRSEIQSLFTAQRQHFTGIEERIVDAVVQRLSQAAPPPVADGEPVSGRSDVTAATPPVSGDQVADGEPVSVPNQVVAETPPVSENQIANTTQPPAQQPSGPRPLRNVLQAVRGTARGLSVLSAQWSGSKFS